MLFVCIGADGVCDTGTENAYLRAWFRAQKKETMPVSKSLVHVYFIYHH